MRKQIKYSVATAVVLILAVAWVWRYTALNQLFEENYLPHPVEYSIGEEVEYGKNRIYYGCSSEGYSVVVQGREILSFDEYAGKYGFAPTAYEERFGSGTTPYAVVEVTAVIKNIDDTSGESYVPLQEFMIHGNVWSFGIDTTLFMNSNPDWDPSVANLYLDPGDQVTVVLPFSVVNSLIPERLKESFKIADMWLLVTNYPENINIRLSA